VGFGGCFPFSLSPFFPPFSPLSLSFSLLSPPFLCPPPSSSLLSFFSPPLPSFPLCFPLLLSLSLLSPRSFPLLLSSPPPPSSASPLSLLCFSPPLVSSLSWSLRLFAAASVLNWLRAPGPLLSLIVLAPSFALHRPAPPTGNWCAPCCPATVFDRAPLVNYVGSLAQGTICPPSRSAGEVSTSWPAYLDRMMEADPARQVRRGQTDVMAALTGTNGACA